ncbi:hypothetical protein, partial [Serratia sarumanii]|uniref:hypothetical protein n=1 Tax=Serratia sarumanii TaxID=3020826 RepID=UPI003F818370
LSPDPHWRLNAFADVFYKHRRRSLPFNHIANLSPWCSIASRAHRCLDLAAALLALSLLSPGGEKA